MGIKELASQVVDLTHENAALKAENESIRSLYAEAVLEIGALKAQEPVGVWRNGFGVELTEVCGSIPDGTKLFTTPQAQDKDGAEALLDAWLHETVNDRVKHADMRKLTQEYFRNKAISKFKESK